MQATSSELRILTGLIIRRLLAKGWSPPNRIPDRALDRLTESMARVRVNQSLALTQHELELLEAVANGSTIRQASALLGPAAETLKKRMMILRRKMAARTSEHAVALAVARGWVMVNDEEEAHGG